MGGKNISTTAQKLGAVNLQTSCYGVCIPLVWGQTRVSPNLVYYTDFKATPHTEKQAGKGGGSNSNTTYTYTVSCIFAMGEGPLATLQVFNNKDVLTPAKSGFTFYPGTLSQSTWPYLSSNHPNDAYNYSGTAIAAQANMALDDSATMGNYSMEVQNTNFSIPAGQPGSPDCNPADILPDLLLNPLYGAVPGLLTFADLTQYRKYCQAMGFFLSPALTEQKAASDHLKDFMLATNSEIITSARQLKVIPYGDQPVTANGTTYLPNNTPLYDLGPDDFIVDSAGEKPIQITRGNPKTTFNCIPVEFLDRANQYNTNTVQVIEPVDAGTFGLRQDTAKELHAIVSKTVAQKVSLILAQRSVYLRNTYKFKLNWRFCLLEPMDLLTLTEPTIGFQRKVVRITKMSEDSRGRLTFTAQEWPFGVATATAYATQSSDVAPVNQAVAPGNVNTPVIFDYPTYLTSNQSAAIGVAASGGQWWGGCQVWISADNASYTYAGDIQAGGRYGVLTAAYGNNGPYDTSNVLSVDLSQSNAPQLGNISADYNADFANLVLVDNELMSYQTATLVATGRYNLSNLYRGVLGTVEASHAAGAKFVRMDNKTLEIPITAARIGKPLYLKFLSFNIFGKSLQALSDVTPYTFTPNPGWSVNNTSEQFTVNGTVNGIAFTWGLGLLPGAYVVELYEGATAGAYAAGTATQIWSGNATGKLIAKTDTITRYYWIRPRAQDGRYGALSPAGNGLPGHATLVNAAIVLIASPGSATADVAGTAGTTNGVTVNVTGGTGPFTYAWSWQSGGAGISIDAATSATTTFSASGLALHETRTGTARCLVTDTSDSSTQTIFVNVELDQDASPLVVSASLFSCSVTGTALSETTPATTVGVSGGQGPYSYSWAWVAGGAGITINSPAANTTSFTDGAMSPGLTTTGTARCTVSDAFGQTATVDISVSLSCTSPVQASVSPGSESAVSPAVNQTTGTATVTAQFGHPGYSYAWGWISGGAGVSIDAPTSASTSFTATGLSASGETRSGTARCTVTDTTGSQTTVQVTVSIQRTVDPMSVSASPANVSYQFKNQNNFTSVPITVSVQGGSPPYTYAWSWVSGDFTNITLDEPSSSTTTITTQHQAVQVIRNATAQCTVTDSQGLVRTCSVTANFNHTGI